VSNLAYQEGIWEDEQREEWVNGELICMAPPRPKHNVAMGNLYSAFSSFLKGKRCQTFIETGFVHFSEKDMYIPDVMVVCTPEIIKDDGIHGVPDLAIEVLSPSTAKFDKGHKKDTYEKHGVKEYWIVDADSCRIEVHLLEDGKYVLDEVYTLLTENCMKYWKENEKQRVKHSITPSIFPEMSVKLEDIFGGWVFGR